MYNPERQLSKNNGVLPPGYYDPMMEPILPGDTKEVVSWNDPTQGIHNRKADIADEAEVAEYFQSQQPVKPSLASQTLTGWGEAESGKESDRRSQSNQNQPATNSTDQKIKLNLEITIEIKVAGITQTGNNYGS